MQIRPLAFWTASTLPAEAIDLTRSFISGQFGVPTTDRSADDQPPTTVRLGRYWRQFRSVGNAPTHLVEVFANVARNGSIEYAAVGFAEVNDSQLTTFLEATRGCLRQADFPRIEAA